MYLNIFLSLKLISNFIYSQNFLKPAYLRIIKSLHINLCKIVFKKGISAKKIINKLKICSKC